MLFSIATPKSTIITVITHIFFSGYYLFSSSLLHTKKKKKRKRISFYYVCYASQDKSELYHSFKLYCLAS